MPFPSTRSSILTGGPPAWLHLFATYREPLRDLLVSRLAVNRDAADDLLQDFFAERVIQQDLVTQFQAHRGRFRSFIVRCLLNFALSKLRSEARDARRASVVARDERHVTPDPFDVGWARELLAVTVEAMRQYCEERNLKHVWHAFLGRLYRPCVCGDAPVPYEQLAIELGLSSPLQAANALTTAKRVFQRLLREKIALYCRDEAEIEEELRDLVDLMNG